MATQWTTFPIKLEGGLTTNLGRIEQGMQAPGSATVLQNFEPDVEGGYTRINGFSKFIDTPVPGEGLIRGILVLGPSEVLVERGGKYQYSDGGAWVEKGSLASSSINKVRKASFNFDGDAKSALVDGINGPAIYNHITKNLTYTPTPPPEVVGANRVEVFKSHIFFAKGRFLSFTSPFLENDFTTGTGAGIINVGDNITGLTVFRDQLIVFCLSKIFRLSGNTSSDFVLSPITSNTGCLCGDTAQEVGGDIMYLGPDGVRYLSASERENDFGLVRASEKIQKKILAIANTNCLYSAVTISSKNQYRLFNYVDNVPKAESTGFLATKYSNQTVDDIAWAELKGFKIFTLGKLQERDREVIFFSSNTDYVYRMESGNSLDGDDIEAIFETPFMPITDPKVRKTVYKHTLYAKPSGNFTLTVQVKFDYSKDFVSQAPPFEISGAATLSEYGALDSVYGTATYGKIGESEFYNNILGSGFVVAVRYSNTSQQPPFNLNFVIIEFRNNERR